MSDQGNFVLNLSVLYRNTQKYFDRVLIPYEIGSGQLTFLLFINENEGITMQELTRISEVDKGTTTKSVQRLIDQGYVQALTDEKDRRVKRLYTTEKAAGIMNDIYDFRNSLRMMMARGMDFAAFEAMLSQAADNARSGMSQDPRSILKIGRFQKFSVQRWPGLTACGIDFSGCNFKCPYCRERNLVFIPEGTEFEDPDEIMAYLMKRKGLIDAVCLSGGEPLMQEGLEDLLVQIRSTGYQIRLETNGSAPDKLRSLIEKKLVDYVAMDIKNTPEKYAETAGVNKDVLNFGAIRESVQILKEGNVPYEFVTPVVRELHTEEDILTIAKLIAPAQKYILQVYEETDNPIQTGFHAYSETEMEELLQKVRKIIPETAVRGGAR